MYVPPTQKAPVLAKRSQCMESLSSVSVGTAVNVSVGKAQVTDVGQRKGFGLPCWIWLLVSTKFLITILVVVETSFSNFAGKVFHVRDIPLGCKQAGLSSHPLDHTNVELEGTTQPASI